MSRMSSKGLGWIIFIGGLIVVERYAFGHAWGSTLVATAAIAAGAFIGMTIRRDARKHQEDIR